MQKFDIREYKQGLRNRFKNIRLAMTAEEKEKKDISILNRVCATWEYQSAGLVLTYVSTPIEVDTRCLIEKAFSDHKLVAVPYCVEQTRDIEFYLIGSMDELAKRTFGVLEPVAEKSRRAVDFTGSICIVPGLSFDSSGYRLGYGKGYYDRFLSSYGGCKIGVCYSSCMMRFLHRGKYDIPCDMVINEHTRIFCRKSLSGRQHNKSNRNA